MACPCNVPSHDDGDVRSLVGLGTVREHCPALKLLLAPDEVWEVIVAESAKPLNDALHCSCLLKAYNEGTLARLTGPIHRFLFSGGELHPSLTNQYRRDLQERWLSEPDEVSRHEKFRMFFGKVVELQVAEWLIECGWNVIGLEALGAPFDIAASSSERVQHAIEVKYIGQGNDDFDLVLGSLRGGSGGGSLPLYGAINYLLFRTYEAAVAIRRHGLPGVAVVVVDDQAWVSMQVPLERGWVDWRAPALIRTEERDWNDFLDAQRNGRYPGIDTELTATILELNRIVVLRLHGGFRYTAVLELRPAG